jgi:hypothetical protein
MLQCVFYRREGVLDFKRKNTGGLCQVIRMTDVAVIWWVDGCRRLEASI